MEAGLTRNIHYKATWAYRGICKSVAQVRGGFSKVLYSGDTIIQRERGLRSETIRYKKNIIPQIQQSSVKNLFKQGERSWNANLIWNLFKRDSAYEILSTHIAEGDKKISIPLDW